MLGRQPRSIGLCRERDANVTHPTCPEPSEQPQFPGPDPLSPEEWRVLRSGLEIMARRALGAGPAAEDAVQETLARALTALRANRLEQRDKLGAFVAGIARHVIADVQRERQRVVPLPPDFADPSAPPDPLTQLLSQAERQRVRRGLASLSAADREVLRLSYFEGLTPAEIARRMAEPAPRIRKRKSRALDRLRRVLQRADRLLSRSRADPDETRGGVAIDE
jgi:RNA polymerase sigma factor (sigma-70 family)